MPTSERLQGSTTAGANEAGSRGAATPPPGFDVARAEQWATNFRPPWAKRLEAQARSSLAALAAQTADDGTPAERPPLSEGAGPAHTAAVLAVESGRTTAVMPTTIAMPTLAIGDAATPPLAELPAATGSAAAMAADAQVVASDDFVRDVAAFPAASPEAKGPAAAPAASPAERTSAVDTPPPRPAMKGDGVGRYAAAGLALVAAAGLFLAIRRPEAPPAPPPEAKVEKTPVVSAPRAVLAAPPPAALAPVALPAAPSASAPASAAHPSQAHAVQSPTNARPASVTAPQPSPIKPLPTTAKLPATVVASKVGTATNAAPATKPVPPAPKPPPTLPAAHLPNPPAPAQSPNIVRDTPF